MTNDKADFTQGNILKKLVAFMMPVLGALILQAAYGAVDLLVVGRFGSTSGLSAVSTGSQVLNLVTFVVIQFAMGITVLIARYLGEKRPEQIGSVIGGAAIVFTMISIVLFIAMVGFAHPISVLMQAPEEAVALTASYVRICGSGIFFIVAYNLLSAIFRGLGDSKSPLLFVLVAAATIYGIRRGKTLWGLDLILFFCAGIAGCILAFLALFSQHPAVSPNYLLFVFHPLHLFCLPWMINKVRKRQKSWYMRTNCAVLTLFILLWAIIPQRIDLAVLPLALCLLVRSASNLILTLKKR